MKTYENEMAFVNNFAKDVNNGEKNYSVNGIEFEVSGKHTDDKSGAAMYHYSIAGQDYVSNVTALKKRVNVTYTREKAASDGSVKVTLKSDEEIRKCVEAEHARIANAVSIIAKAASRYGLETSQIIDGTVAVNDEAVQLVEYMFAANIAKRDEIKAKREAEARERAEQVAREAADKADKIRRLTEAITSAMSKGDYAHVAALSKELSKIAK